MEMANQWKTHRGVFIAWAVEFVTIANRPSCNRWFCVFYEKVRRPLSWKSNICDLVRNVSFFQESQTIYYLQSQLCRTEPSFRVDVNETKVKSKLKACDRLLFDKALLRTLTPNSLTGTCCTQGPVEGTQCPGCRKVPTTSQVLSSIQHNCSWKSSGSNMGHQTCFLPRALSDLDTPPGCMQWKRVCCPRGKERWWSGEGSNVASQEVGGAKCLILGV